MNVMKIRNIKKSFGEVDVLNDVHFDIAENATIGLVGYNGTGKTTLANVIAGKSQPDSGTIETIQSLKIGYLTQSVEYQLFDYQKGLLELDNKGYLEVTSHLGLDKVHNWEEDRFHHLSGGEKLKIVLAQIWNSKPNFLLLDEPTNHLDLQGINWLIDELKGFQGPVIIISHDRYFLDEIATSIIELDDGQINEYTGNYTKYRHEKDLRKKIQLHHYEEQQRYKQKIENQMEQLRTWSDKAHRESTKGGSPSERRQIGFKEYNRKKAKKMDNQVKSKMKRLEKELEKKQILKPKDDPSLAFQFQAEGKKGKRVVEAKNIGKSFNGKSLFHNSQFYIKFGEKIGIIGPNGCGKTTLIRMLLGEEEISNGELWKSPNLKLAYLSQDLLDLNPEQTVLESFGNLNRDEIFSARTLISNIGLPREIVDKKIETLSLGQRIRVKIVDMLLKEYDILILDEPTNHLDLPSREQLESTLKDFKGTILTVSHDYYFINSVCDTLLVFEQNRIKRVEKTLAEYQHYKNVDQDTKKKEEELLIIDNRLTTILGQLSLLTPSDAKYSELDSQFKQLLQLKKKLS
ncbi:ribosomal protection-like ABC-F family protein [Neobacillus sp. D3-1R]|uniref:ribosomal protection-like ABC-F family protein n=1 Tax=Neobacillus sp. D3-1R TaxID=3445778 RepID=UPI003F9FE87D